MTEREAYVAFNLTDKVGFATVGRLALEHGSVADAWNAYPKKVSRSGGEIDFGKEFALAEKFGPLGKWLNKKPNQNAEKKPVFAWVKPFFAKCKGWAVTAWSKIREAVKGLFAKKQKPAPTEPEVEEPTETAAEETADPEE